MLKILILDDEESIRKTLKLHFSDKYQTETIATVSEFEEAYSRFNPDLLLLDLKLPDGSGLDLLQSLRNAGDTVATIMITGHSDMESPICAMRMGATDYIKKPLDIDEIEIAITRVQSQIIQQKSLRDIDSSNDLLQKGRIIGRSKEITNILKKIGTVSQGKVNVLITGESGTGKELVAQTIHLYSSPEEPFIAVNCSALSPHLIESELFGHEKGAFTHAIEKRIGRLELAKEGTLFLDEIGELPVDLQVKLLRVIQEQEFESVGGNKKIRFKARILSATNRNLQNMMKEGSFREDLYFRLCTEEIHIPPLRERIEDIPELVEYLVLKTNHKLHKKIQKIPENVLHELQSYSWPGNIRELENVLVRSALLSSSEVLVLPKNLFAAHVPKSQTKELLSLAQIEKKHILKVLRHTSGNISHACGILGISRPTLRKKINEYQIAIDRLK
ncbi:sigma-54-dependent transcriptional regulator [Candidatus Uabimicrobium amorphum]|uniref:Sigma-54-dependent Fis family transcriptional regulator n=1 Tax=Uabimicrobium amorphum TaxID=2596890 RepID=A0A5S9ISR5_UABAM|nr:sigma-54 dependent transcriptional regulator [Candidatus Uabimicrobium amorphum]BBM87057.1 sigma-54-dependent Fis family transcriptional regulator [Candidatus Uabimicrobium amorphum]